MEYGSDPPWVRVFFGCRNSHAVVEAPELIEGATVKRIVNKAGLFGERDRKVKVRAEVERLDHGSLLTAIQQAVAAL